MTDIASAEKAAELRAALESTRGLPVPAREFVAAAKKIVRQEGFGALTLQRIADEVGGNKASIWYYFGGKPGLIEAIIHDNVLENCTFVAGEVAEDASDEARVEALIAQARYLLLDPRSYEGGFDVFAYSMHHKRFREQWVRFYAVWFHTIREKLGIPDDERSRVVCQLFAAMIDGLAMQQLMGFVSPHPDSVEPLLKSIRMLVTTSLQQLRALHNEPASDRGNRRRG